MTSEDVSSQLEREPFVPLRLHLVSGKTVDIRSDGMAYMLQNSVMILHEPHNSATSVGSYDVVALRNIERIEQLPE